MTRDEAQRKLDQALTLYSEAQLERDTGSGALADRIESQASALEAEVANAGFHWNADMKLLS